MSDNLPPIIGYIPVAGTHEAKNKKRWSDAGSVFDMFMRENRFERRGTEFGFWDTALAGTFFTLSGHLSWQFGGNMLYDYLKALPFKDRVIIAHSYGGAVAAYALARRPIVEIRALITVDTPIRCDLDPVWDQALDAIGLHVHLYSVGIGSWVRFLGQRGRFKRQMLWADANIRIKGGHSGILRSWEHTPQMLKALTLVRMTDGKPEEKKTDALGQLITGP